MNYKIWITIFLIIINFSIFSSNDKKIENRKRTFSQLEENVKQEQERNQVHVDRKMKLEIVVDEKKQSSAQAKETFAKCIPWVDIRNIISQYYDSWQFESEDAVFAEKYFTDLKMKFLRSHSGYKLGFSPSGKYLAFELTNVGCSIARILEFQTKEIIKKIDIEDEITTFAISDKNLALGYYGYNSEKIMHKNQKIEIYDLDKESKNFGNLVRKLDQTEPVVYLRFLSSLNSKSDNIPLFCNINTDSTVTKKNVIIWDITGKKIVDFPTENPIIHDISFNGKYLASTLSFEGYKLYSVILDFNLQSKTCGNIIEKKSDYMHFTTNNKYLLVNRSDGIEIYDSNDFTSITKFEYFQGPNPNENKSLDCSPDGKYLACTRNNKIEIFVFSENSKKFDYLQTFECGKDPKILFSPDGKYLVCASFNKVLKSATLKVWKLKGLDF